MTKAAVLERERRSTAGTRMSSLVGKAAEEDDAFWSHSTWAEDKDVDGTALSSDDGSFHESDEEVEDRVDNFDSDFNDSESEDGDKEEERRREAADVMEHEKEMLREEKRSASKKRGGAYSEPAGKKMMDIVSAGRELMQKKKGTAARKRALMGEGINAGLVLNVPGSVSDAKRAAFGDGTKGFPLAVPSSATGIMTAGATSKKPALRQSTAPKRRRSNRTKSALSDAKRSLRASTLENSIQTSVGGKGASSSSASTSSFSTNNTKNNNKSKATSKRKFTQEELLMEAAQITEAQNERWILSRKRVQDQAQVHAELKKLSAAAAGGDSQKKILSKFHSRRGCYNTITFPEMDFVPEVLVRKRVSNLEKAEADKVRAGDKFCVITGKIARYRDPKTRKAYHDLAAFKELRRRFNAGEPLDQPKIEILETVDRQMHHEQLLSSVPALVPSSLDCPVLSDEGKDEKNVSSPSMIPSDHHCHTQTSGNNSTIKVESNTPKNQTQTNAITTEEEQKGNRQQQLKLNQKAQQQRNQSKEMKNVEINSTKGTINEYQKLGTEPGKTVKQTISNTDTVPSVTSSSILSSVQGKVELNLKNVNDRSKALAISPVSNDVLTGTGKIDIPSNSLISPSPLQSSTSSRKDPQLSKLTKKSLANALKDSSNTDTMKSEFQSVLGMGKLGENSSLSVETKGEGKKSGSGNNKYLDDGKNTIPLKSAVLPIEKTENNKKTAETGTEMKSGTEIRFNACDTVSTKETKFESPLSSSNAMNLSIEKREKGAAYNSVGKPPAQPSIQSNTNKRKNASPSPLLTKDLPPNSSSEKNKKASTSKSAEGKTLKIQSNGKISKSGNHLKDAEKSATGNSVSIAEPESKIILVTSSAKRPVCTFKTKPRKKGKTKALDIGDETVETLKRPSAKSPEMPITHLSMQPLQYTQPQTAQLSANTQYNFPYNSVVNLTAAAAMDSTGQHIQNNQHLSSIHPNTSYAHNLPYGLSPYAYLPPESGVHFSQPSHNLPASLYGINLNAIGSLSEQAQPTHQHNNMAFAASQQASRQSSQEMIANVLSTYAALQQMEKEQQDKNNRFGQR